MTDILKSFSSLQSELDLAKNSLKCVDEDIKRLIGRDPSELPIRPSVKRNITQYEDRGHSKTIVSQNEERRLKNSRLRLLVQENEETPIKRRSTGVSVFKRLSDRPVQSDKNDNQPKQCKGMISKVIVTPKEIPSRKERMDAQSKDLNSVARNKRMFGALLGTLQKFQQEETKLKMKEDKRAQLEKKIEEHEIKEKEEIKKERQELFFNRKKKQAEIKMIELKMIRMKEYSTWEGSQKHRMNFIYTKTKPPIHFLPRKFNNAHKELLENSRIEIQSVIDTKREQIQEELTYIEERGRKIFEPRKSQQGMNQHVEHEREGGTKDGNITPEVSLYQEKVQENLDENNSFISDIIRIETQDNEIVVDKVEVPEEIQNADISINIIGSQLVENLQKNISVLTSCKNNDISSSLKKQIFVANDYNHSNLVKSTDFIEQVEAASSENFNENNIVIQHTGDNFN